MASDRSEAATMQELQCQISHLQSELRRVAREDMARSTQFKHQFHAMMKEQTESFSKTMDERFDRLEAMLERMLGSTDKETLKNLPPCSSQTTVELSDPQSSNGFGVEEMWKRQSHTCEVLISDFFPSKEGSVSDFDAGGVIPQMHMHKVDCDVVERSEPNKGYTSQFEKLSESQCSMKMFNTKQLRLTNTQRPLEMSVVAVMIHNKNQAKWQQGEGSKFAQIGQRDAQDLCHRDSHKWYHRHRYKHKGVGVLFGVEEFFKVKEIVVIEEYGEACSKMIEEDSRILLLVANSFKRGQPMKFEGQSANLQVLVVNGSENTYNAVNLISLQSHSLKIARISLQTDKSIRELMVNGGGIRLVLDELARNSSMIIVAHIFEIKEFNKKGEVVFLSLEVMMTHYHRLLFLFSGMLTDHFNKSLVIKINDLSRREGQNGQLWIKELKKLLPSYKIRICVDNNTHGRKKPVNEVIDLDKDGYSDMMGQCQSLKSVFLWPIMKEVPHISMRQWVVCQLSKLELVLPLMLLGPNPIEDWFNITKELICELLRFEIITSELGKKLTEMFWVAIIEWCYIANIQRSNEIKLFHMLYGYFPLQFTIETTTTKRKVEAMKLVSMEMQLVIRQLMQNLVETYEKLKKPADSKWTERSFNESTWMPLNFQPYYQNFIQDEGAGMLIELPPMEQKEMVQEMSVRACVRRVFKRGKDAEVQMLIEWVSKGRFLKEAWSDTTLNFIVRCLKPEGKKVNWVGEYAQFQIQIEVETWNYLELQWYQQTTVKEMAYKKLKLSQLNEKVEEVVRVLIKQLSWVEEEMTWKDHNYIVKRYFQIILEDKDCFKGWGMSCTDITELEVAVDSSVNQIKEKRLAILTSGTSKPKKGARKTSELKGVFIASQLIQGGPKKAHESLINRLQPTKLRMSY